MSMFEDSRFRWRETYFVLFRSSHRPKLKAVEKALAALDEHYQLANARADEQGRFESLSLISPDDFAALDVCYTAGAEVLEQAASLAQEIRPDGDQPGAREALQQLVQCDARFEVLHFEQVPEFPEDDEEPDGMLDPSTLLLVLQALAKISEGIAVDPQAGEILGED